MQDDFAAAQRLGAVMQGKSQIELRENSKVVLVDQEKQTLQAMRRRLQSALLEDHYRFSRLGALPRISGINKAPARMMTPNRIANGAKTNFPKKIL
jgi:hypothetical protein